MKQDYTETDAWDAVLGVCVLWRETQDNKKLIEKLREKARQLDELVMMVETKYPGETRIETLFRYVKEREASRSTIPGTMPCNQAQGHDALEADLKAKGLITKARSVWEEE